MTAVNKKLKTKVKKWGNSLAIRLPIDAISTLHAVDGSAVSIEIDDKTKKIVITEEVESMPTLTELVSAITPKNLHTEVDWGKPVGGEVW